jgi:UDP-N-acetylenolpyruvoylglucosamine reductase
MNTSPAQNPPETSRPTDSRVDALAAALAGRLGPDSVIRRHEPLAKRTTLRVGGAADLLVEPADESDLGVVLEEARRCGVPWRVLGRGSNLLVRDGGVRGAILVLSRPAFSRIDADPPRLRCGAGARLNAVSAEARRLGLAGLEFLGGIPGSVGGALRMNAGAWSAMTFEKLETVRFMTPEGGVIERPAREVPAVYRRCELFRDHIALGAVFVGEPRSREEVEAKMDELNRRRWASQPAAPSAGCIFKNPATLPAGRLVDELGLKGTRIGGAAVSEVHGNFIVNEGGATAADVLALIDLIQRRAREERGIELETEVEIIGE